MSKESNNNNNNNNNKNELQRQADELLEHMEAKRKQWKKEDDDDDEEEEDDTDRLLQEALDMAIQQGKGWAPGEKEEYMAKILDDDFIPPIFASSLEEVEQSGLAEAFSTLHYDDSPARVMMEYKAKGTDAFLKGKRNEAKNKQYYRDAVNHYYTAFAWAQKVEPIYPEQQQQQQQQQPSVEEEQKTDNNDNNNNDNDKDTKKKQVGEEEPEFTEDELDELKSTLYANAALAHMQLKNWGHVRDDCKKALIYHKNNIKAWYRLAKAHEMLQNWEEAGDAIDNGLNVPGENNKDLLKLQKVLSERIRKARLARQQRERRRAERTYQVKQVWKHCQEEGIQLGRIALVSSVSDDGNDDNDGDDDDEAESKWHFHHPHTGELASCSSNNSTGGNGGEWSWPCLFVYPSHSQSDFVKHFGESEMLAMRMAEMFPEVEIDGGGGTAMPWDYNNEFQCSQLAVYFEINVPNATTGISSSSSSSGGSTKMVVHPDSVELLQDQGSTMKFYEASRALKGDEGPDMVNVVLALERKRLYQQRKAWKKKHKSLWAKPDPSPVVRVHPACQLLDILKDPRMVVANFVVTLVIIPENHPVHEIYLKEHPCVGLLQPKDMQQ